MPVKAKCCVLAHNNTNFVDGKCSVLMTCLQILMQVAINGLLSFQRPFSSFNALPFDSNFFAFRDPIIAPFWADYSLIVSSGSISYRRTTDTSILRNVTAILAARNPQLQSYHPTLAFIATWNEVPLQNLEVSDSHINL